jgi:hypothetical protein
VQLDTTERTRTWRTYRCGQCHAIVIVTRRGDHRGVPLCDPNDVS